VSRFGILEIQENQVKNFVEKPQSGEWASAGYFVFNRRLFDYLDGDACILEQEPLERLAREGQLMSFQHSGFFYAMDTYREFLLLNSLWSSGNAPWKLWD
jgi:glucose-1-phosphate cytidylyltransferase